MKDVLLLVHDDGGQEARFQIALDVVEAVRGHVICVDIVEARSPAGNYGLLFAEDRARDRIHGKLMEERLRIEDLPWIWVDAMEGRESAVGSAAGMADLIVLNRKLHCEDRRKRLLIGDELVASGRPLLAVPEAARRMTVAGAKVLIAWDGSEQAINALIASVPLVRLARKVLILELGDGIMGVSADDAATYLARHGIAADIVRTDPDIDATVPVLIGTSRSMGADYIVMGGFAHWRLAESMFDGTPHRMLAECPAPLFLAH
ncbi:MAG TPA: universal stress protein [Sphingomonas sp.]|nr:universal stress protein [Sphingomonas sp.]